MKKLLQGPAGYFLLFFLFKIVLESLLRDYVTENKDILLALSLLRNITILLVYVFFVFWVWKFFSGPSWKVRWTVRLVSIPVVTFLFLMYAFVANFSNDEKRDLIGGLENSEIKLGRADCT